MRDEAVALEPDEIVVGEQRQAHLGDVAERAGRRDLFDRIQIGAETHPEIGILPADDRVLHLLADEGEIGLQGAEIERLIGDGRVDAEAAAIGAAEAADHRHELDRARLLHQRLDIFPALAKVRYLARLGGGGEASAERAVRRRLAQDLGDLAAAGQPEHIVEMARRILGIAARMRPAEHGDRAPAAIDGAQRIGGEGGERVGAEEQKVGLARRRRSDPRSACRYSRDSGPRGPSPRTRPRPPAA